MVFHSALLIVAVCCNMGTSFRSTTLHFSPITSRITDLSQLTMVADDNFRVTSLKSLTLQNLSANLIALSGALAILPAAAVARQGAFEMDVEYYLKTVASRAQGKPDAVIDSKTSKPAFASPRSVNKDLADSIVEAIQLEICRIAKAPVADIATKVGSQMLLYLPYFKAFVPIKVENLSDQYYFDVTLYVTYLLAAQLIPKSTDRVILRKSVGDRILNILQQKKLLGLTSTSSQPPISPDNLQSPTGDAT